MKRNIFTPLLLLCFCLLSSLSGKAQNTLWTQVQIDPLECAANNGFTRFMIKAIAVDQTATAYAYHIRYDQSNAIAAYTTTNAGDTFVLVKTLDTPIHRITVRLYPDGASVPSDSFIVLLDTLCQYSIYGSLHANTINSCTAGPVITSPASLRIDRNGMPVDTITGIGVYGGVIAPPYPDSVYTLTPIHLPLGYTLTCPATGNYTFTLDTFNHEQLDFGLNCSSTAGFDLYNFASGIYRMEPLFSYLNLNVGNAACSNQNGTVTLTIDPAFTFYTASITPTSVIGQVVTWNFSNLNATDSRHITVTLNTGTAAVAGNIACSDLSITPVTGDNNTANNSFSFCDTIRNSWDPNDKKVSPAGNITPGAPLSYTINFENLGNDTAFNVSILDTLSEHLELSTLELVTSSHSVRLLKNQSAGIIRFSFPNIRLADKNHPQSNKGFVIYKIKAKTNLAPGTVISNTGHIYFDRNEAVVTNTVSNKIPDPSSIKEKEDEDGLRVYPNPAGKMLFVRNENNRYHHAKIVNTLGQVMMAMPLHKDMNRFDTGTLPTGIYYLVATGAKGSTSVKLSKL